MLLHCFEIQCSELNGHERKAKNTLEKKNKNKNHNAQNFQTKKKRDYDICDAEMAELTFI